VPRSSAERWVANAREEALDDDSEAYRRGLKEGRKSGHEEMLERIKVWGAI
jgi:hypothetical protein